MKEKSTLGAKSAIREVVRARSWEGKRKGIPEPGEESTTVPVKPYRRMKVGHLGGQTGWNRGKANSRPWS
ncbi:hypothetical protein [Heliophilum fasciatum]|uniref:hypothetical protein n=1 Tax=Heliophilum fasciatum TaxID=35700 RepID=UPI0010477136|nr:hypothetical protein [Heliophilum fasciatum]MCW2278148.1 hypothetical protein [Heliophilum fasciatum]